MNKKKNQREFEPIAPTLLKNPFVAGWGLLPTLRWAGSYLLVDEHVSYNH
jgi:hypothetical protein